MHPLGSTAIGAVMQCGRPRRMLCLFLIPWNLNSLNRPVLYYISWSIYFCSISFILIIHFTHISLKSKKHTKIVNIIPIVLFYLFVCLFVLSCRPISIVLTPRGSLPLRLAHHERPQKRVKSRDVARLFKMRGGKEGSGASGGGDWLGLKMAALHRPLYKV